MSTPGRTQDECPSRPPGSSEREQVRYAKTEALAAVGMLHEDFPDDALVLRLVDVTVDLYLGQRRADASHIEDLTLVRRLARDATREREVLDAPELKAALERLEAAPPAPPPEPPAKVGGLGATLDQHEANLQPPDWQPGATSKTLPTADAPPPGAPRSR